MHGRSMLRIAQRLACLPGGAARHDCHIGREEGEVELDAERGGRRGWWWVRKGTRERLGGGGHVVSSDQMRTPKGGGRKSDRQGSLIEARIRPAFMLVRPLSACFVPNLIGTNPPWPGRLPPLRRSAYRFRRCRLGCGCALGGCWGACAIAPRPFRRLVRAPGGSVYRSRIPRCTHSNVFPQRTVWNLLTDVGPQMGYDDGG